MPLAGMTVPSRDRSELKAVNVGRSAGGKKPRWRITQGALEAFEAARTPTVATRAVHKPGRRAEVVKFY